MLMLGVIALSISCTESKPEEKRTKGPLQVEAYKAEPTSFSTTVTAVGDLLANEKVVVKAPVAGHVQSIHFQEGERVKEGDMLVQLDDRSWKARKKGLEASLVSAESQLKRKKNLLEVEGASKADVEQARAQVENLKASIEEMRVMINLAQVHAPFNGRIGMRDFSKGAYLNKGGRITSLVQSRYLRVNFTLPAKYRSQISKGSSIKVVATSTQDTLQASVYAIAPVMDKDTRSLRIRARLDNTQDRFTPGDFVQLFLRLRERANAIMVPAEAIIPELNKHVVYKIHNGKAVRHQVGIGKRTKRMVEITRGLNAGDTVMVTGLLQVREGQQITVESLKEEGAL